VSAKKKWKADDIQTLIEWKKVTADIFGPLVKVKPIKATKNRSSYGSLTEKNKPGVEQLIRESVEKCQMNEEQIIMKDGSLSNTDSVAVSNLKLIETSHVSYDEEKSILDDSFLFEFTNVSETKLVSATEHKTLDSCVASSGEARQPTAPKGKAKFERSQVVVRNMERKFFLSTPDETFDYQWVDLPPSENFKPEIAVSFQFQSQNVCSKSATVTSISELNTMEKVKAMGKQTLGKSSDYSVSSRVGTEQMAIDFECKSNLLESDRPLDRETFILSFPLIITDSNRKTELVDSTNFNRRMPSVTKILQATQSPESRQVLLKWEKQMIAELGEAGFSQYKAG